MGFSNFVQDAMTGTVRKGWIKSSLHWPVFIIPHCFCRDNVMLLLQLRFGTISKMGKI